MCLFRKFSPFRFSSSLQGPAVGMIVKKPTGLESFFIFSKGEALVKTLTGLELVYSDVLLIFSCCKLLTALFPWGIKVFGAWVTSGQCTVTSRTPCSSGGKRQRAPLSSDPLRLYAESGSEPYLSLSVRVRHSSTAMGAALGALSFAAWVSPLHSGSRQGVRSVNGGETVTVASDKYFPFI